ncbi:MAG: trypsin-like serine protease [Acidobacteria bacterium]|nr:trypsin-like serine protease [Acidobacteriota bacterium]
MSSKVFRVLLLSAALVCAFALGTIAVDWRGGPANAPLSADPFWTTAQTNGLTADETANIDIYDRASKATVNITSTVLQRGWFFEIYPQRESGSGFLIDDEGRILTNFHVLGGGAPKIEVNLLGEEETRRYEAKVLAVDEVNDLALIQIQPDKPLPYLTLAEDVELKVGQKVLAIGNPFGLEGSLTVGVISSLGRSIRNEDNSVLEDMIQTDAAINPGNSGGPLLNSAGAVIGVNTAIYGPGGNIGIGFAMPIGRARPLLEFVRSGGAAQRPEHPGFTSVFLDRRFAQALELPPGGYLVAEVESGSAAAAAGLRGATREVFLGNYRIPWGGDYIVAVDGRRITSQDLLRKILALKKGGDALKLTVLRDGEEQEIAIVLRSEGQQRL